MLFIVPDADDKPAADAAPAGIKVELDLDDAPFLADDEPAAPPPPEPEAAAESPLPALADKQPEAPKKGDRLRGLFAKLLADKKRLIIAGGAGLLLIVIAVVVNVFLFGEKKAPPPTKPAPVYEVIPDTPPPLEAAKLPYAHLIQWEPFLVEQRGDDGGIRFVTCKISIPAADQMQYAELMAKRIVLRDAVYYFLANRRPELLSTEEKNKAMREDIVGVLNGHLTTVVKDVYIEEYMVTTP